MKEINFDRQPNQTILKRRKINGTKCSKVINTIYNSEPSITTTEHSETLNTIIISSYNNCHGIVICRCGIILSENGFTKKSSLNQLKIIGH